MPALGPKGIFNDVQIALLADWVLEVGNGRPNLHRPALLSPLPAADTTVGSRTVRRTDSLGDGREHRNGVAVGQAYQVEPAESFRLTPDVRASISSPRAASEGAGDDPWSSSASFLAAATLDRRRRRGGGRIDTVCGLDAVQATVAGTRRLCGPDALSRGRAPDRGVLAARRWAFRRWWRCVSGWPRRRSGSASPTSSILHGGARQPHRPAQPWPGWQGRARNGTEAPAPVEAWIRRVNTLTQPALW